jgi:hypothetical protein
MSIWNLYCHFLPCIVRPFCIFVAMLIYFFTVWFFVPRKNLLATLDRQSNRCVSLCTSHCSIFNSTLWPTDRDRCYDFLNIFAEKFSQKIAFLTQIKAKLCKILIITLVFDKNANFFAKNCLKSQKFVIITSTPGSYAFGFCHYNASDVCLYVCT